MSPRRVLSLSILLTAPAFAANPFLSAKDDKPVATMLLNMASIKDSYANYEQEHKALYG